MLSLTVDPPDIIRPETQDNRALTVGNGYFTDKTHVLYLTNNNLNVKYVP